MLWVWCGHMWHHDSILDTFQKTKETKPCRPESLIHSQKNKKPKIYKLCVGASPTLACSPRIVCKSLVFLVFLGMYQGFCPASFSFYGFLSMSRGCDRGVIDLCVSRGVREWKEGEDSEGRDDGEGREGSGGRW